MVEANLAVAAEQRKAAYDHRASSRTLRVGDMVWFISPNSRKFVTQVGGGLKRQIRQEPLKVELTDSRCSNVVHINHVRHRIMPKEISLTLHGRLVSTEDRPNGPPTAVLPTSAIP